MDFLKDALRLPDGPLVDILMALLSIVLILVGTHIVIAVAGKIIDRSFARKIRKNPGSLAAKKSETLSTLFKSIVRYVIYFCAVAGILSVLGLGATVSSLLATAGIGGVALGLGAQTFVKDIVAGFCLLLEDEFAVGDYVKLGDYSGTVVSVSLRTTRLRLAQNEIAALPNGSIDVVVNYTRDSYLLFFDVWIDYAQDEAAARAVFEQTLTGYAAAHDYVLEAPDYLGVAALTPAGQKLRAQLRVVPVKQWQAERELNALVAGAFKQAGIRTPGNAVFVSQ